MSLWLGEPISLRELAEILYTFQGVDMPPQKQQSDILAKYRTRMQQAHEQHAGDETEFSNFGELPEGIENGIAQLFEVKIDQYKTGDLKGEPFLHMAATVIRPEYVGDIKVQGKQTRITMPLCDTPKSKRDFAENYARALNEFRKLGLVTEGTTSDQFEAMMAALVEMQPFLSFRTWKGKPTKEFPSPRVQQTWEGACDPPKDFSPDDPGSGVSETPPAPQPNGEDSSPPRKAPAGGKVAAPTPQRGQNAPRPASGPVKPPTPAQPARTAPKKAPPPPPPEPEPAVQFSETSIEDLVAQASGEDQEQASTAQAELIRMAENAGFTEEQVRACDTWEQLGGLIQPPTTEQEEGSPPQAGEVYLFRGTDAKTKKPAAKATEHEVTEVDEDKKTVTLVPLDDRKRSYKTVSWDALEGR